jgi:hypothetical protein
MSDELTAGGSTPGEAICPWCSAPLAATDTVTCSSCGAKLQGEGDKPLPGLTAIDPLAVIEGARPPQRPRNRLVAWLTGADIDEGTAQPASPEALAPPAPEVRREMLRLQMEAELSQLSAEAEALATDEAVAAADQGDTARAQAAVAAVLGADAETDAVNEAAEDAAAATLAEEAAMAPSPEADEPAATTAEAEGAPPEPDGDESTAPAGV